MIDILASVKPSSTLSNDFWGPFFLGVSAMSLINLAITKWDWIKKCLSS